MVLRGSRQTNAILTEAGVAQARREHVPWSREFGVMALARKHKVSLSTMKRVLRREAWEHVE